MPPQPAPPPPLSIARDQHLGRCRHPSDPLPRSSSDPSRSHIGRPRETTRRQARARSPANPRLLWTRPLHPDDRHHSGPPRRPRTGPKGAGRVARARELPSSSATRTATWSGFGVIRSANPSPVTSARLMPRYGSPPTSIDVAPENVPSARPRNSRMDSGDRSSTRRSAWPSESMSCRRITRGSNHGRRSRKSNWDCTICHSCHCPGPCWTVPR